MQGSRFEFEVRGTSREFANDSRLQLVPRTLNLEPHQLTSLHVDARLRTDGGQVDLEAVLRADLDQGDLVSPAAMALKVRMQTSPCR